MEVDCRTAQISKKNHIDQKIKWKKGGGGGRETDEMIFYLHTFLVSRVRVLIFGINKCRRVRVRVRVSVRVRVRVRATYAKPKPVTTSQVSRTCVNNACSSHVIWEQMADKKQPTVILLCGSKKPGQHIYRV
ncbi:hypothetical protein AQUCO_06500029v1 [Aquilegia coerulea]|uniref:Uncharacterized protein n=1 Tax=Aquilegia coerulea TaxID=218851 RepID=A0A2G5CCD4_AQUCA|nr:hypothetical protein AQUCO_06500029v1 [Aquilegia coerulea]